MDTGNPETLNIIIPSRVSFADLDLTRDPKTGMIHFRMDVITQILLDNNIEFDAEADDFGQFTFNVLMHWYCAHMQRGGDAHPVMDALLSEVMHEDARGSLSFAPGHA